LYGWIALPLVAWAIRIYRADRGPIATLSRAALVLWSLGPHHRRRLVAERQLERQAVPRLVRIRAHLLSAWHSVPVVCTGDRVCAGVARAGESVAAGSLCKAVRPCPAAAGSARSLRGIESVDLSGGQSRY